MAVPENYSLYIKDLKQRQIKKLAQFLDVHQTGIKYWYDLAQLIYQGEIQKIAFLKQTYAYGGPGSKLLATLSTTNPNLTVTEFLKIIEKFGRQDFVLLLEQVEEGCYLKDIKHKIWEELVKCLEKQDVWRGISEEMGLHASDLDAHTRQSGSPTAKLIEHIKTCKVDYTLRNLADHLGYLERHDAKEYIEAEMRMMLRTGSRKGGRLSRINSCAF